MAGLTIYHFIFLPSAQKCADPCKKLFFVDMVMVSNILHVGVGVCITTFETVEDLQHDIYE